jgi:hypothetical protein
MELNIIIKVKYYNKPFYLHNNNSYTHLKTSTFAVAS